MNKRINKKSLHSQESLLGISTLWIKQRDPQITNIGMAPLFNIAPSRFSKKICESLVQLRYEMSEYDERIGKFGIIK